LLINFEDLKEVAENLGLLIVSFLSIDDAQEALLNNKSFIKSWQDSGFAADMKYMQRSPDFLCDLYKLLPTAKSILTFCVPYYSPVQFVPNKKEGFGSIAKYAWGLDYHDVLKNKLNCFVELCKQKGICQDIQFRAFSDSVPLPERTLAAKAGQGFIGKSSMLIRPGMGTYFFICELIINKIVKGSADDSLKIKANCGKCVSCKKCCPTNAIVEDKIVDSRKCISYLTIEKRGLFDKEEISSIGSWIFGCDICQEVCPYNHKGLGNLVPLEFNAKMGVGPELDILSVLSIKTDSEFRDKFKGTALLRTKRFGLLRNALAVAANQKLFRVSERIFEIAKNDDSDLLRKQAAIVLELLKKEATGLDSLRLEKYCAQIKLVRN
jgi:epoxyqueuosine reductase